ncbi:hypothetical protein N0V85_007709 [Neurospora sp. IMI 360204]|nr:hypothetical protein N0V85_007709 [Neurospora sp. IMI 360204]
MTPRLLRHWLLHGRFGRARLEHFQHSDHRPREVHFEALPSSNNVRDRLIRPTVNDIATPNTRGGHRLTRMAEAMGPDSDDDTVDVDSPSVQQLRRKRPRRGSNGGEEDPFATPHGGRGGRGLFGSGGGTGSGTGRANRGAQTPGQIAESVLQRLLM